MVDEQQHGLPHPPLCIIADMFFSWSAEIAHEFGIFHAIFCVPSGFGTACYYSLWLNLPHRNTNSDEFMLLDFPEASNIHVTQLPEHLKLSDGKDTFAVYAKKVLPQWLDSDRILVYTMEELGHIGLLYFRQKIGKPIWSIGLVLLSVGREAAAGREARIKDCNE